MSAPICHLRLQDPCFHSCLPFPGSFLPANILIERINNFPKDKELYVYCKSGVASIEIVQNLRDLGYTAFSIKDGYFGWLSNHINDLASNERANSVEESIRKRFHKNIFSRFCKAINEYQKGMQKGCALCKEQWL